MKKIWMISLVLCICMLSACCNHNVSGTIVETGIKEENGIVSFVIQTEENEAFGILVTDKTHIFSFADGMNAEDFRAEPRTDVIVSVDYEAFHRSLVTQNGKEISACYANQIEITGYLKTDAVTLTDGTNVKLWQYWDTAVYTLENGTELLRVQPPIGPDNVHVIGAESLDDLKETAQKRVLAFYQNQGLLYDEQAELERAYANCLLAEDAAGFQAHMLSQDTAPTASSDTVMYFLTTALFPIDGTQSYEVRLGAAFDRNTGAHMDNWELFSCSPDEAIRKLLDIAGIPDPALREEMTQAFNPDNIILFPENLEICFAQGTLPSQEDGYILSLDYDDRLLQILHEWAVPTRKQ